MLIDIIMPYFNGNKWINSAINSITNQDYTNWKLYVINDNPNDILFLKLKYKYEKIDNRILFIDSDSNLGAPGARMKAISHGQGEIITFIDQDDEWDSKKLSVLITTFNTDAFIDIVHSDIEIIDSNSKKMIGISDKENKFRRNFNYRTANISALSSFIFCNNSIRIGASSIKRISFQRIHGFNTKLFGGEDWEFWTRAASLGLIFQHIPLVLSYRRLHSNNVSSEYFKIRSKGLINAFKLLIDNFNYGEKNIAFVALKVYKRAIFAEISSRSNQSAKILYTDLVKELNYIPFNVSVILFFMKFLINSGILGYYLLSLNNFIKKYLIY